MHPADYKQPFAIFMEDGNLMVLWACSQRDFQFWTDAFIELKSNRSRENQATAKTKSNLTLSQIDNTIPLPEVSDSNYFVANIYLCLLPEDRVKTDIDNLETTRS